MEKYKRPETPCLSTDIIIEYTDGEKEGIVLIERKFPPYGLALPGGHAEVGLTLEENARKEGSEETSLDVMIEHLLCVKSDPKRDPRVHMVAVVYVGKGKGVLNAGDDAAAAQLYSIEEVRALRGQGKFAFDHEEIINEYLRWRGHL